MHVLLVEDNAMNRHVMRDMLGAVNVPMAEAEDGRTGLGMIEQGDYDLILMDLRMPGMDGNDAVREIRARADDKASLPIVIVTADTRLNIRTECMAAGANDVLMKPVRMSDLFDTMGRIIAERANLLSMV